jgi:hypothetical protein
MTVVPFDFVRQLGEVSYRLLQTPPGVLALGEIHRAGCFGPLPRGAPGNGSDDIQVAD